MNRTRKGVALGLIAAGIGIIGLQAARLHAADQPQPQTQAQKAADTQGAAALTVTDISLDQVHEVVMAAIKKAQETNTKMDIAVVDAGGNLKGFVRMDGAWLGSIDISIKKAKTARFFDMPTGEIGKLSQPGQPLYQIEVSNGGLISFPGGVPIKSNGQIIGAIGVSGSTVQNDHTVAQAGADVIE